MEPAPPSDRSVDINMGVSRALAGWEEGPKGLPESEVGIGESTRNTREARIPILLLCGTQHLPCRAGHIALSQMETPRTLVLVASLLHSSGYTQYCPASFAVSLRKEI